MREFVINVDVFVHAARHGGGEFAWADETIPGGGIKTGKAQLVHGGNIEVAFGAFHASLYDGYGFAAFDMGWPMSWFQNNS